MPISIISRIKGLSRGMASGLYDPNSGTQNVAEQITLAGNYTVKLDPSLFNCRGVFTLFRFGSFLVYGGMTAQQILDQYLTIDTSLLTGVTLLDPHGTIDLVGKKITITLV